MRRQCHFILDALLNLMSTKAVSFSVDRDPQKVCTFNTNASRATYWKEVSLILPLDINSLISVPLKSFVFSFVFWTIFLCTKFCFSILQFRTIVNHCFDKAPREAEFSVKGLRKTILGSTSGIWCTFYKI